MAVPVVCVCLCVCVCVCNDLLHEVIRWLCLWFISMNKMLGGSLTTNTTHTLTVTMFTLLTPQISDEYITVQKFICCFNIAVIFCSPFTEFQCVGRELCHGHMKRVLYVTGTAVK